MWAREMAAKNKGTIMRKEAERLKGEAELACSLVQSGPESPDNKGPVDSPHDIYAPPPKQKRTRILYQKNQHHRGA